VDLDDRGAAAAAAAPTTAQLLEWVRATSLHCTRSRSIDGMLEALVRGGADFGVVSAAVGIVEDSRLVLRHSYGIPERVLAEYRVVPLGVTIPGTDVARLGMPVFLGSRRDMAAMYPGSIASRVGMRALATLPLTVDSIGIGSIGVAFDVEVVFTDDFRMALEALAAMCAASLDVRAATGVDADATDASQHDALDSRVQALEQEMAAMRELLSFLGAIATQRLA
jgi:GAF domain-containing protein